MLLAGSGGSLKIIFVVTQNRIQWYSIML